MIIQQNITNMKEKGRKQKRKEQGALGWGRKYSLNQPHALRPHLSTVVRIPSTRDRTKVDALRHWPRPFHNRKGVYPCEYNNIP